MSIYVWQVHDATAPRSGKWGMRIDRGNDQCTIPGWSFFTTYQQNVVFRNSGMIVKGNNHSIHRNLIDCFQLRYDPHI